MKKIDALVQSIDAINIGDTITFHELGYSGKVIAIQYITWHKMQILLQSDTGASISVDLKVEFPLVEALDDF